MRRIVACLSATVLLALLALTTARAFQSPVPSVPSNSPTPSPLSPPLTPLPPIPPQMSVDQLLDKLEELKAKKEAIEKEQQKTTATLKERLEAQKKRLQKVGFEKHESDKDGKTEKMLTPASVTSEDRPKDK